MAVHAGVAARETAARGASQGLAATGLLMIHSLGGQ